MTVACEFPPLSCGTLPMIFQVHRYLSKVVLAVIDLEEEQVGYRRDESYIIHQESAFESYYW